MAIKFYNIKYGETRTVDTAPMLAAFFNSTNLHVNAMVGQDLGWRIAPETIKQMREIQDDEDKMAKIEKMFQLPEGEIQDIHILNYISIQDAKKAARKMETVENNYEQEYQDQLRALDEPTPKAETKTAEKTAEEKKVEADKKKAAKEAKQNEDDKMLAALQDEQRVKNGDAPTGVAAKAPADKPKTEEKVETTSEKADNKPTETK